MEVLDLSKLIDLGSAGVVIVVVVYFLRFIEKRDQQWQDFFKSLTKADNDSIKELALIIKALAERVEGFDRRLQAHDQFERGLIQAWASAQQTQPNNNKKEVRLQDE